MSSDAAAHLISEKFDTNKDGVIDFHEFCVFVMEAKSL